MEALREEQFFQKAYEETLKPAFGDSIQVEDLGVEGNIEQ